MLGIASLQRYIPASVKNLLKPYYRTFFPNRLHVIFWVTFRCNYRCSYCPVVTKFDYGTVYPKESERTAEEWLAAYDKLPPALIYISGGEPFMYKGLPAFVNGLKKHAILGIVTNATVSTKVYESIEKPLHLNLSFHREFTSDEKFLAKIEELRHKHHINVNIVATPENLPVIEKVAAMFKDRRVSLHVDPYIDAGFKYTQEQMDLLSKYLQADRSAYVDNQLDYADYGEKRCSAGKNYINVLPNGDVYTCMGGVQYNNSPLTKQILEGASQTPDLNAFRMGNLFDPSFHLNDGPISCSLPCTNACDLDSTSIKRVSYSKGRRTLPVLN